jgi:hypothetical protein
MSKSYAMTLDFTAAVEDGCLSFSFPHREITFSQIGLAEFTRQFSKPVWLEVFLLARLTGLLDEGKRNSSQLCKLMESI